MTDELPSLDFAKPHGHDGPHLPNRLVEDVPAYFDGEGADVREGPDAWRGDDRAESDMAVQAEEPVEDRIARAFANGWHEGFMRGMAAERGHRLDHS